MIVVGFIGGLASQMNDYAFLLAMRKRVPNCEIKAVNGCFEHNGYELDRVFGVKLDWADPQGVKRMLNFHLGRNDVRTKLCNGWHRLRTHLIGPRRTQLNMVDYSLPNRSLPLDVENNDCVFWGNCTRETYPEVDSEFRKAMEFKLLLSGENRELAGRIGEGNSVSIHLRRGDYVRGGYRLLQADYYREAIRRMEQRVENPHYYIFSDDVKCAQEMFGDLRQKTFVDWNKGADSCFDMRLMSLCKHNIIANSGFSFMAAWLNATPGKVVVAPRCPDAKAAAVTEKWGWIQI